MILFSNVGFRGINSWTHLDLSLSLSLPPCDLESQCPCHRLLPVITVGHCPLPQSLPPITARYFFFHFFSHSLSFSLCPYLDQTSNVPLSPVMAPYPWSLPSITTKIFFFTLSLVLSICSTLNQNIECPIIADHYCLSSPLPSVAITDRCCRSLLGFFFHSLSLSSQPWIRTMNAPLPSVTRNQWPIN